MMAHPDFARHRVEDHVTATAATFLKAEGQCCLTEAKLWFQFLLAFKVRFHKIYLIFSKATDVVPFIGAF